MLRSRGSLMKWTLYALAFFLLFFLECCVCNRYPISGGVPLLAPLAVITVACLEGSFSGSLFGLAVGVLCALVYYRIGGVMILACTLLGVLAGVFADKIGRTIVGVLVSDVVGVALLEVFLVWLRHTFYLIELDTLLAIAVPEGLYTLAFALPSYLLLRLVHQKCQPKAD